MLKGDNGIFLRQMTDLIFGQKAGYRLTHLPSLFDIFGKQTGADK